jgi:F-type H+-transporting ATPase subunit epsilon
MNKTINFELVSPEEKLVSEPVKQAVIPGEEGEFGVGPDHCSLVVTLKPGVVALHKDGQEKPRRIFIAGGFADVTGLQCTVLAEEAIDLSTLNAVDIEQQIKALEGDLKVVTDSVDRIRLMRKLSIAKAKLYALSGTIAA